MSKSSLKTPLSVALGAAFVTSLAATPLAHADQNPFSVNALGSGYMVADGHEGKCGEGKCGGAKSEGTSDTKGAEGKCGEGKCGGAKSTETSDTKGAEGKCGEGKCGSAK